MCYLRLDIVLTRLSQADGILCRWIFKRLAYAVDNFSDDGAIQEGYAEEDYTDEGFNYASWRSLVVAMVLFIVSDFTYVDDFVGRRAKDQVM